MKGSVTALETGLLAFVAVSGLGFVTMPRVAAEVAGKDAWLAIFLTGAVALAAGWAIMRLNMIFPTVTAVEYSEAVVGRYTSGLFMAGLLIYLLGFAGLSLRAFADVLKMFLLNQTPLEVTTVAMLAVVIYATQHGINTLSRLAGFFGMIVVAAAVFILLLSFQKAEFYRVQPILDNGIGPIIERVPRLLLFYLPGMTVFFFLVPFQRKPNLLLPAGLTGISTATVLFTLASVSAMVVLGLESVLSETYPFFTLAKTIAYPGTFLERLEAIYMTVWILSAFLTTLSSYCFANLILVRKFRLRGPRPFPFLLAPVVYVLALLPANDLAALDWVWKVSQLGAVTTLSGVALIWLVIGLRWWISRLRSNEPAQGGGRGA